MRTIWYMGSKSRLIPGFVDAGIDDLTPREGTVFDLFAGTGAVSAALASRYRVYANDVQQYSRIVLSSLVDHGPRSARRLVSMLDFDEDIRPAFEAHRARLAESFAEPLAREAELLAAAAEGRRLEAYRRFALTAPRYPQTRVRSPWKGAAWLFDERTLAERRTSGPGDLYHLISSYYHNLYFGLHQALDLDSLRFAIDGIRGAYAARRRRHYLAALLYAASVSTSGTSHFAQPRSLSRDSEVRAVARRRQLDVAALLREYSAELAAFVKATDYQRGNKVFRNDYRRTLRGLRDGPDTIYADPPYTSDNYSRFYHVLEVLARYDFPKLQPARGGGLAKGRYPELSYRFQSGFCTARGVEEEFEGLVAAAARTGANLALSYARPTGLLFKVWLRSMSEARAKRRFLELFRRHYRRVTLREQDLVHSGQGDAHRDVTELLVLCKGPRVAPRARARAEVAACAT